MNKQSSKGAPRVERAEEGDPKQLGSSLLQEFQNLKDKFKNDDETVEKG